jgi:putative hemolysin
MPSPDRPDPHHIVDRLIEERAPRLCEPRAGRWAMRRLLYPWLGYAAARAAVDRIQALPGRAIMELAGTEIAMQVRVLGASRLPRRGRIVIAANHPTGLADGVALWRGVSPVRDDLRFLANGDALRLAPGLVDVVIPVEWVKARRTPAGSRRVLGDLARAFRDEAALVFFPSGRLAHLRWRGLSERPWQPTVVTVARKFQAPIVPLHIRARNSWLFYALSRLSDELRDVTLFHELLNKRGRRFELTVGAPIDAASLPDDPAEATTHLQRHVETDLPRASREQPRIGQPAGRGPARIGVPRP